MERPPEEEPICPWNFGKQIGERIILVLAHLQPEGICIHTLICKREAHSALARLDPKGCEMIVLCCFWD